MRKILLTVIVIIVTFTVKAQEPADALRYSWTVPGASARIKATGGAMGSLGGDITATFVNPAGLAFYRTGDFVFTPVYSFGNNKANYLGRNEKDKFKRFTWGTTGVVFGAANNNGRHNLSWSIAYNRMADFNSNILYRGQNNKSSYSQKYLEEIQNGNIKDANTVATGYPYGTSLAFNTFWIDTVAGGSSNNFQFQTRAPFGTGLLQQNTISTKGGIDEFALGFAMSSNNRFYFGGSLGIPVLHFKRQTEYIEADATDNPNNHFNYAQLNETLSTSGAGINLKAGIIYKPIEYLRLGLAFHSPTLYQLTDSYSATITTDTEKYMQVQTQSTSDLTDATSAFKYVLITPYRVIGSISYVLREVEDITKQKGFITADAEYINYKASSFQPDQANNNDQSTKDYLKQLNTAIDNAYKGAFNFRVGGELKFTTLMVRLGGAFYGNPYKNINGESGNKINLSGGLGYRNKGFFIDLTYVHSLNKDISYPYRLQYAPYYGARVNTSAGNIYLTAGFKI